MRPPKIITQLGDIERALLRAMQEYHRLRAVTISQNDPMQKAIKPLGQALKELSREIQRR